MDETHPPPIPQASEGPNTRKPRILFLVTEYYYFASHKKDLVAAASDAGFEVYVAARCIPSEIEEEGKFKIIPLAWKRSGSTLGAMFYLLPDIYRVRGLFREVKPDVVHNISLKPSIIGSLAAFGSKINVVNSINGFGYVFYSQSPLARLVQYGCKLILRLTVKWNNARIVLQNRDDKILVREKMAISSEQVWLIRGSGIDASAFQPEPEPPSPPFKFLILARLLHMKGIQVAIAAIEILIQRGVQAQLIVCGSVDPGNPSSIPESVLQTWSNLPGVTFMGHVGDVKPMITSSHVVVLPALGGEGLPRALLEAAALARPMIATDIAGNREIVLPGETGLLVPPNDPEALARAMEWIATHPEDREQWGRAARRKVVAEFTSEFVREQHVQLYRVLMEPQAVS
jgi:glycosyltransferase involved in cell wall biosynthesis